jgi:hypothetical protein
MDVDSANNLILAELVKARSRFPIMASYHEGYAILLEEVEELWSEIKQNPKDRDAVAIREEAMQVAAMAMRFLVDLC